MPVEIPEPWLSFLRDVDRALSQSVEVHCLGGFVLVARWGRTLTTGDVDFIAFTAAGAVGELLRIAGEGSEIAQRHRLHFHAVTVAEYPEAYASRLTDLTPQGFTRLRLLAFEIHDLVLAKLGRNSARDRFDVEFLARRGLLDKHILQERFETELRPYLINDIHHTDSLRLWLNQYFPGEP